VGCMWFMYRLQTTNPQILIVICCIHLHIHHMSRIPFLILSFLDFFVFIVTTLIFIQIRGNVQFLQQTWLDPASVVQVGHHRAQQIDRQSALQTSQRENKERISFTFTFRPHNHAVKSIILKNFKLNSRYW